MFSFSASGEICCPMIVYPYKRIPEKIANSVNPQWGIGRSDTGWMTAETFYAYIKNIFYPHLVSNNVTFPVILLVDGHKSHLSFELSTLCIKLQIEIIALYLNATRILQPADVAAFCPLKGAWRKAVRDWYTTNPGEILNKTSFSPLLENVIHNGGIKNETLINGFKICGSFPFNADAVDYSKCLGKQENKSKNDVYEKADKTMNYNEFLNIIGLEKVQKFEKIRDIAEADGNNEYFWDMYRVWQHFKTPAVTISQERPEELIEDMNIYNETYENNNNVEQIHEETVAENAKENCIENGNLQNEPKIIVLQNKLIVPSVAINTGKQLECVNSSDSDFNNGNGQRQIEEFLINPPTPERKGKRQTERLPFAITSQKYRDILTEKRELQQRLQNEKVERKRKREENKKEKVKKPATTCFICKLAIRSKLYLTCDSCKQFCHNRCVPRKHRIHIPEEKVDDLYLCQICYKPDNDETSDNDEILDDDEITDNGVSNIENEKKGEFEEKDMEPGEDENEEIDRLYEMYKQRSKENSY